MATFLVACGGGTTDDTIKIEEVTPAFGPLSGGTRVTIKGQGFLRDGAPPNRVVIGNTEAPLAAAADDQTLEVVTPPSDMAGDAPIIVFNRNGQGTAMGVFHYSTGPTIASVSPNKVVFDSNGTVTVTGSGFKDENAGPVRVFVDGTPAVDVTVTSDTELSFSAPTGTVLAHPTIEVVNARGTVVHDNGFQFTPAANPTLLAFTRDNQNVWAYFYDPVGDKVIPVPNKKAPSFTIGYRASYVDANGDIWVMGRDSRFGKLDVDNQVVTNPVIVNQRINSLMRVGTTIYATAQPNQFGTLDQATGNFTQITTATNMCCGTALAENAGMAYLAISQGTNNISTINPTTGARGTPVTLNPAPVKHIGEMRFIGNKLYASTSRGTNGDIVTIDPATGLMTVVKNLGATTTGIEVFQ